MLQYMESQRVRHNWATELNWIVPNQDYLNQNENLSTKSTGHGRIGFRKDWRELWDGMELWDEPEAWWKLHSGESWSSHLWPYQSCWMPSTCPLCSCSCSLIQYSKLHYRTLNGLDQNYVPSPGWVYFALFQRRELAAMRWLLVPDNVRIPLLRNRVYAHWMISKDSFSMWERQQLLRLIQWEF